MPVSGNRKRGLGIALCLFTSFFLAFTIDYRLTTIDCFASEVKEPNVAGSFYPADPAELSQMLEGFFSAARPQPVTGDIIALISPHAGYPYSGQVAAYGYKLIQGKDYKTVVVIGPSHHYVFSGVSVYPQGAFRTPLGELEIDSAFAAKLLKTNKDIFFDAASFAQEHSIEVQLPFLQKALPAVKIVPVVTGDCTYALCEKLAGLLKAAIGNRKDVLVVASTDMYHGDNFAQAGAVDKITLDYLKKMDAQGLYYALRQEKAQLCGGFSAVTVILLARDLGHNNLFVLKHTNSAEVTGNYTEGNWTVGYASCAIDQNQGGEGMLNKEQRKKLLALARSSIETYLKTAKKPEVKETDPLLTQSAGAFVTLNKAGRLRGCIGNLVARGPLYLAVRDMAIEAALSDPRFPALEMAELKNIEIEISVLSPMRRVASAEEIKLGTHGVLVKRGFNSGVFLPQVALETGWSKEEFLSELCAQKAGLPAGAWKDKSTEIYVFTAEVFSEKER